MRKVTRLILLFCMASMAVRVQAQKPAHTAVGFVHAQGKELVDGAGKPLMLRGTSFGNWLVPEGYMWKFEGGPQSPSAIIALSETLLGPEESAKFWKQYQANYITRDDVQFLKRAGFNSIRIPFHYKFFAHGSNEGFVLIDPVVRWAQEAGLYIILDMHAAPGGQTGANIDDGLSYPWLFRSEASQKEFIAIWARIAQHYRDNRTVLGYELLNEPIPAVPALDDLKPMLEPLLKKATAAIRAIDKNHTVILTGANWDNDFNVLSTPFDMNLLYTFHRYSAPPTLQTIQPYLDFREKYNVPVWLGESGENNDAWVNSFRAALEEHGVGWAFWPYKKMDAPSSPVTFAQPPHWDVIVKYASGSWLVDKSHSVLRARPTETQIREAYDGLLKNIQFAHCTTNDGYVRALGLTIPPQ